MADTADKSGKGVATLPGWRDLAIGGTMMEGGSAANYSTGDWRTSRPLWDDKKCIHCLICWVFCPDTAILVEDGKIVGIDYEHCKGCGICASECPSKVQAITMAPEADYR